MLGSRRLRESSSYAKIEHYNVSMWACIQHENCYGKNIIFISLTNSSCCLFNLFSVFFFPEPLPWNLCDIWRNAYRTTLVTQESILQLVDGYLFGWQSASKVVHILNPDLRDIVFLFSKWHVTHVTITKGSGRVKQYRQGEVHLPISIPFSLPLSFIITEKQTISTYQYIMIIILLTRL